MAKYSEVTTGQTEACINRMGGWNNFLRFIGGQGRIVFDSILSLLRTVRIPAQPAITTSEEYFKEARIVWMGKNFKAQFLGLEVPATDETELAVRKLEEDSLDASILGELGNKAEISVSQLWAFLNAHHGSLEWFIFYPKDKLWAVRARWNAVHGGWYVYAYSVANPNRWLQGNRVVSQV